MSELDDCGVTLTPDDYGLPSTSLPAYQGIVFNLRGQVTSDAPITKLTVKVIDSYGKVYSESIVFSADEQITTLRLDESISDQPSLDSFAIIDKLKCGKCLINIYAQSSNMSDLGIVYSSHFNKISDSNIYTLSPNNFRSYFYTSCLNLFKDPSLFLFTYKQDAGRYIKQFSKWESQNLVKIKTWTDRYVYVNKVAKPYFEEAYQYISTTYLRVRSDSFDSGIIPLSEVAAKPYGTYVARFVKGKRFISHHAFGTAQDINADYPSNVNRMDNRQVISAEVALLDYEGLFTDDYGNRYHSFVYRGECTDIRGGVPETISNYLIYELALFRAGFGWGYYYDHTCDAMHFSVSELPPSLHEAENGGLRKVYTYE